jgi:hypothetical protein
MPEASWPGLIGPRFMLRHPYGKKSDRSRALRSRSSCTTPACAACCRATPRCSRCACGINGVVAHKGAPVVRLSGIGVLMAEQISRARPRLSR